MKKTLLAIYFCITVLPIVVIAQTETKALAGTGINPGKVKSLYLNDINTRAAGDFVKRYSKATDPEWRKVSDGYIVEFLLKDIKHKTAYNRFGKWVYTIKFYKEAKMPGNIRHIVKREYYDFTIKQVEEVYYQRNPVVYIVHLQYENNYVNVRVCEGELSVLEKFSKR